MQKTAGKSLGQELVQSAHEALEIARGEAGPAAIHVPRAVDEPKIRK